MKNTVKKLYLSVSAALLSVLMVIISPISMTASALGGTPNGASATYVYIRNVKSGKYMHLSGGTIGDDKVVTLYHGDESKGQKWKVSNVTGSWCTIRSAVDEHYALSVLGSNNSNGVKVALRYLPSGGTIPDNAQFMCLDTLVGSSIIISKISFNSSNARVIEPLNGNTADGAQLVMWDYHDDIDQSINQLWVFEDTERSVKVSAWDLVDSGGHCDWQANTKYLTYLTKATSAWNSFMGTTRFRADAWNTVEDVRISDLPNDPLKKGANARTYNSGKIEFYTNQIDAYASNAAKQKTITHELGHALGLDDNNLVNVKPTLGNIMQQGELAYGTSFSYDDKASYKEAAKKY